MCGRNSKLLKLLLVILTLLAISGCWNRKELESLAIVAGMLVLFVTDRLRYDLVAAIALSAAVLTGVVPAKKVPISRHR